jgi:hypothetical protein
VKTSKVFLRGSEKVFLIMNTQQQFYGPSGWVQEPQNATQFSPEDAAQMLKVFPHAAALATMVRSGDERRSGTDRRQQPVEAEAAGVAA